MVRFEPGAAAVGVRFALQGADRRMVVRRSSTELSNHVAEQRLFPELAQEWSVALPAPLSGRLHFATIGAARASGHEVLLSQAAAVVALVVRLLRPAGALRKRAVSDPRIVQLEKLATIGQTTSEIVHELNNPLTAIMAYADYLSQRLVDEGVSQPDLDRLMKIHEAAARIQSFCRDLTDYARPVGSLMTPLELHAVVDRALGFCMHGLRHADITVERVYRDIPLVDGIEASLTQAFVNLITNAWHAMEGRGGGILSIKSRVDGARVIIEVSDDGPGIDAEHLPHVFDQYFTTKPRGSGVGLGLSIVKQIIHDHRGTVSAENNHPNGARMLVVLPRSS
jgi:C4-dicarboxylate-specific signal transduction histidine kinase